MDVTYQPHPVKLFTKTALIQAAGAVEYADCISTERLDTLLTLTNECPAYDI